MPYNSAMKLDDSSILDAFRCAYWQVLRDLDSLRLRQWEQSHITMPQLRVLFQLRCVPGMTTGQLARTLGVTVSTTSGLVAKLVERGLVGRGSSEEDRRQIPLTLTEAGQVLAGELAGLPRSFLDGVATELGDGLEGVVAALQALADAADRVRQKESTSP
jgi:DNA-binding MarR family transcriptional regulator